MEVGVIGLGYVGLTTALGLASLGHTVIGVEHDCRKLEAFKRGLIPFHEPGMDIALRNTIASGHFSYNLKLSDSKVKTQILIIAVPTPSNKDGSANLTYVHSALGELVTNLASGSIVVIKSTVPIGTCRKLQDEYRHLGIHIVSNPEFLTEGNAMKDFMNPSRIVIGAEDPKAAQTVMDLFKTVPGPRITTSLTSAETIKHASNAFLALKLSYVNELAEICEKSGASMTEVIQGMSLDERIGGQFLAPGPGWGGSCFPKDVAELAFSARALGVQPLTLDAALRSNRNATERVVALAKELVGSNLNGKKMAIWGLAFKADTDDIRESPAVAVAKFLVSERALVSAFDPMVKDPQIEGVNFAPDPLTAVEDADCLLVLTEWRQFASIDPVIVKSKMSGQAVIDMRRILDRNLWLGHFSKFKVVGEP